MLRRALGGLAAALTLPASAQAATAYLDVRPAGRDTTSTLRVSGAPGEANRFMATRTDDGAWTISDDGAPLTAGPGCGADGSGVVRCPSAGGYEAAVFEAGDGDDVVHVASRIGSSIVVRGGAGSDLLVGVGILVGIPTLDGGAGDDVLVGGPGQDSLIGGPGNDILRGEAGADELSGGDGDDRLDGGPGSDQASYASAAGPVLADLRTGTARSGVQVDRLVSVEGVQGGAGDDRLRGDDGANVLVGGAGDDLLDGRGGDDWLSDGSGRDTLLGGPGADDLSSADAGDVLHGGPGGDRLHGAPGSHLYGEAGDDRLAFADRQPPATFSCGAGRDVASAPDLGGLALDGCEATQFGVFPFVELAAAPVRSGARQLRLPVRCMARSGTLLDGCTGRVSVDLRLPGEEPRRLGAFAFRLVGERRGTARLALDAADRRALRRSPRPLIALRFAGAGTRRPGYPSGGDAEVGGEWLVRLPAG